eukprot:11219718-Lingulodinium_polyedra.AAC.1
MRRLFRQSAIPQGQSSMILLRRAGRLQSLVHGFELQKGVCEKDANALRVALRAAREAAAAPLFPTRTR